MRDLDQLVCIRQRPSAIARIRGSNQHPNLCGMVRFYQTDQGVLLAAHISGLPEPEGPCRHPVFAFHIHTGACCTGNGSDSFADVGGHFNPDNCPHPQHAGDLPPLFGSGGHAFSVFLTDRFCVKDVIGRTVIIHGGPDDFTSQPAGNAGPKIACGEICCCASH